MTRFVNGVFGLSLTTFCSYVCFNYCHPLKVFYCMSYLFFLLSLICFHCVFRPFVFNHSSSFLILSVQEIFSVLLKHLASNSSRSIHSVLSVVYCLLSHRKLSTKLFAGNRFCKTPVLLEYKFINIDYLQLATTTFTSNKFVKKTNNLLYNYYICVKY